MSEDLLIILLRKNDSQLYKVKVKTFFQPLIFSTLDLISCRNDTAKVMKNVFAFQSNCKCLACNNSFQRLVFCKDIYIYIVSVLLK